MIYISNAKQGAKKHFATRATSLLLTLSVCFMPLTLAACSEQASDPVHSLSTSHAVSRYDVVWTTPSENAGESMPVGSGDMGANVWVEEGNLFLYLERSGFFDEHNTQLKAGRLRLGLSPNPFAGDTIEFKQKLNLEKGRIEISAANSDGLSADILVWVEKDRPVLHLEIESDEDIAVTADYETWRTEDKIHLKTWNLQQKSFAYLFNDKVDVYTTKDTIDVSEDAVWFHHRNPEETIFDIEVKLQDLDPIKDQLWNPMKNRTMGGVLWGNTLKATGNQTEGVYGATPFKGYRLEAEPNSQHTINVALHVEQTQTLEEWQSGLHTLKAETAEGTTAARAAHEDWWSAYWDRGYIHVNPETEDESDVGWRVGRSYQLTRFLMGTNAFGDIPTKFNGHFYNVDPLYSNLENHHYSFVKGADLMVDETPDFRMWGGGSFTAQNQRLLYWPMIKNGDFDIIRPQFTFYKKGLKNAEARTEQYWGHKGASFTEQMNFYALPLMSHYGWDRPDDLPAGDDILLRYLWVNQLEFAYMLLEYRRFSNIDIAEFLPFAHSAVQFFDTHYRYRRKRETGEELDENGKLVIAPSIAAETYHGTVNPADVVSGMRAVTASMLALPGDILSEEERTYYEGLQARLPDIRLREKDGYTVIAPAHSWDEGKLGNEDFPQLYTVYPYGQYGLGKPDLQVAIDTWHHGYDEDRQKNSHGWHQGVAFAARMGLTQEAKERVIIKLTENPVRFPGFFGPDFDWLPDMNKPGIGLIGLQEMLLQTNGDELRLLPAWPTDWDVDFKLYAPQNTVVEGRVRHGVIEQLDVTPKSREADLIISEPFKKQ